MAVAYQGSPRLPVPATRVLGLLLLLLVAASASYAVLQVRITHVLCSNVATQQITYACVHAGGSNGACCCQAGTPCERRCAWNPKRRCRKHAGLDQKQAWGGESSEASLGARHKHMPSAGQVTCSRNSRGLGHMLSKHAPSSPLNTSLHCRQVNVAVREVPGQGRITLAPRHIAKGRTSSAT